MVLSLGRGQVSIDLAAHRDVVWRVVFDSRATSTSVANIEERDGRAMLVHDAPFAVVLRPAAGDEA